MQSRRAKIYLSRFLIAVVLGWNVQCAIAFLIWPDNYAAGFELSGDIGKAMLRGMGILFLMWNVPYAVAIWHPVRHRLAMWEAVIMQAIGLVGESSIYLTVPSVHIVARSSLARFILFDGLGLLALLVAAWLSRPRSNPA